MSEQPLDRVAYVKQLLARPGGVSAAAHVSVTPDAEESAFGQTRSAFRTEVMLEIRYLTGRVTALGYAYLLGIDFDPSDGIVLHFSTAKVTVVGRNLSPLFAGLVRHRVPYVQEVDEVGSALLTESEPVVTRIIIE